MATQETAGGSKTTHGSGMSNGVGTVNGGDTLKLNGTSDATLTTTSSGMVNGKAKGQKSKQKRKQGEGSGETENVGAAGFTAGLDAVNPELLAEERMKALSTRQHQLEKITFRHSQLVQQLFHMERYTQILDFDFEKARTTNKVAFEEYMQPYDLIEKYTTASGPSRRTRRAHNEQRQILASASTSSISAPPISASISGQTKGKAKAKAETSGPHEIISILKTTKDKGKGRQKEVAILPVPAPAPSPHQERDQEQETPPLPLDEAPSPADSQAIRVKRRVDKPLNGILRRTVSVPNAEMRDQWQKGETLQNGHQEESISVALTRKSVRLKDAVKPTSVPPSPAKRKLLHDADNPDTSLSENISPSPSVRFAIKRIRLIVRRPPPTFTNPNQRPSPPKFNNSLPNFLNSYIQINDNDITRETLERKARQAAEIREREQRFRREGRFIPGTEVLFGSTPDESVYIPPVRDWKDSWDYILEEVIARGKTRPKKPLGRQIASQVASKVQGYYDALEAKKIKVLEEEKKKTRNLAKSTMRMIIAEWKKAVFHIREKQRLVEEAEELKRGQDHLDAILDQSGALLETQHDDLMRGPLYASRSRSGSVENLHWGLGGYDDEDEEEEEEEEDEEGEEDEEDAGTTNVDEAAISEPQELVDDESSDEGEEGDVDTALLLMDGPSRPESTAPGTPTTDAVEDDEGPDTSTQQLMELNQSHVDDRDGDLTNAASEKPTTKPPSSESDERPREILDEENDIDIDSPKVKVLPSLIGAEIEMGGDYLMNATTVDEESLDNARSQASVEPSESAVEDLLDSQMRTETPSEKDTEMAEPPVAPRVEPEDELDDVEEDDDMNEQIPPYLRPYAVAPMDYDTSQKVAPPLLLRGVLRPYQQSGMEWLASLHTNRLNGILADEMGLGKTIQTIALLAHLACDRGIWGPHLIVVPTSVLLNWEMEFKKFLPGFRVLSYHGSTKRRKELRQGWNDKHHFNVCITSYTLVTKDAHIFKRKAWYYMILDEAHMIKNFKSQRWNILLMFRSFRRLLLTGTPLQNNLTELWALLQFLMSGSNFANLKEFGEWFSNPLERAIEMGSILDDENQQRVSKLHTVLRPYLLRRLKRDVEKELPSKFEHLTLCPLSKRQRFLYDEFMSRAQTKDALESGVYQKIANILMQLRKVCNHPDLFEVRPIVTSFAMQRSAIADFEIKELLVRRRLLSEADEDRVDLGFVGLRFVDWQRSSYFAAESTRRLDATHLLPHFGEIISEAPPKDLRTVAGFRNYSAWLKKAQTVARWSHAGYVNRLNCNRIPQYGEELERRLKQMAPPRLPFSAVNTRHDYMENAYLINRAIKSYEERAEELAPIVNKFAFVTPAAVALDLPRLALSGHEDVVARLPLESDQILHQAAVKLQIAFPDPSLIQYDCGKLQRLADLLREKKAGGHRILIFTQMTRILDILEIFLNFHGYLYLRLDGATKIEDRQYITERFNADSRVFCFISSSRSGGVGINLTGADTVVFYDSDFNPQMDRQCEDRAHRIGQIRDVHIYRFVSQHTVEEAMLRKANQKRSLDDIVIQKGEFDWRTLFNDEGALTTALGEFEDVEDRNAAVVAEREENSLLGADANDFEEVGSGSGRHAEAIGDGKVARVADSENVAAVLGDEDVMEVDGGAGAGANAEPEEEEEEGGAVADYMVKFVERDYDFFREWRL